MRSHSSVHLRAYRTLVLLYPRSFRGEYRDLMVEAFREDLDARGTRAVWCRTVGDLLVSVPVQLVEATMSKPSKVRSAQLVVAFSILAVVAVVAAGRFVVIIAPAIVAVMAAALLYWRSTMPYREAVRDASASWWRVILAGAVLLGGIGVTATYGPHMDWFPWHLAAFLYLTAWVAMILGAVLGVIHLVKRLRRPPVVA